METLQAGMRKCEKLFINPGSSEGSSSHSTNSESATANALENEEAAEKELAMRRQEESDVT